MNTLREAEKLSRFHERIGAVLLIGGTPMPREQRDLTSKRADILVVTPGRLIGHLEETKGMAERLAGVQMVRPREPGRWVGLVFVFLFPF